MISLRLLGVVLGLFLLEEVGPLLLPPVAIFLDPLLLFLIFLCLKIPSGRFLWVYGLGLGILKDLTTGGLFGLSACTFGFIGWVCGTFRHLVEREDPLLAGIWAGLLSGAARLIFGFLTVLADSQVGWNRWFWAVLPLSMAANGGFAFLLYPYLERLLLFPVRRSP